MTVHTSGETIDAVLVHLRAEEPIEGDPSQRAVLRHEAGVLEEQKGDEEAALREYLAACDDDPEFREPVEALLRIYERRRDPTAGRLLESFVDLAHTPEAAARALRDLAAHRLRLEDDVAQARVCLDQAVEQSPRDAAAWIELELVAARERDEEARMRALEARAQLTQNPTWQGLLLVELADVCAAQGDVERAANLLDHVVGLDGQARFPSRVALAGIARQASDQELWAHALEGQAELIAQGLDDPSLAERAGVPPSMRTAEHAADAWIRAGELRRRAGDGWGAVAALSAAGERLGNHPVVARLSMAAADAAGDAEAAVKIAREQLEAGVGGSVGASLYLRLAQAFEEEGDFEAALEAYGRALELDPNNIVALTLRTDLLAQGDDAQMLATAIEAAAEAATTDRAKARAMVTAAYVRSVRAGDIEGGKQALAKSLELGAEATTIARAGRTFAALCGDAAWFEEATLALLQLIPLPEAKASLWFELGRSRLRRGDAAGANDAFTQLASVEEDVGPNVWLGRALIAYAAGAQESRDPKALAALASADPDPSLGRGLTLVAALAGLRAGGEAADEAVALLQQLHEANPDDAIAAAFLTDVLRGRGKLDEAAAALHVAATACTDPALGAALQIEAGFVLWQAGKHPAAIEAFEAAMDFAPQAAQTLLAWSLRAAAPEDLEARLRAIDISEELDGDQVAAALERFGLGVASEGTLADPIGAVERLEELSPGGDVALATALARLLVGTMDVGAIAPVLEVFDDLGDAAGPVAKAEQYRLARFVDRDAYGALEAAAAWHASSPSIASSLEWLAAAFASDDRGAEMQAREALAGALRGEDAIATAASAATVRLVHLPGRSQPLVEAGSPTAALLNLELALPGGDPTRRARALRGVDDLLGDEARVDAMRLAAWNELAAGAYGDAQDTFRELVEGTADDMASWEGFRVASEMIGDHTSLGVALARLGNLCQDDERAAALWEQAGIVLLEHTDAHADAEIAFERALDRDNTRFEAFDKLFRRVRKRKENQRMLQLIEMRLQVTNDETEVTKMYWERARVYRDIGDNDRALDSLKDVTMLEPDHVGALALSGEVAIKKGDFEHAAPTLARLAGLDAAPKKQRLLSGIAAVDLYEKRLDQPEKALDVLLQLYRDGLSTAKVRERLARTSARVGNWEEAVKILERLMEERDSSEGRAGAARLAMRIYRDKLKTPGRAVAATRKLLTEQPDNAEAIRFLIEQNVSADLRDVAVPQAQNLTLQQLETNPFELDKVKLVAQIAEHRRDLNLRRAVVGVAVALGDDAPELHASAREIDGRSTLEPMIVLDDAALAHVSDRDDRGPIPQLFHIAAPVIAEALGPSTKSEDVGRRQRTDSGPIRTEVSRWMGALGIGDFQLYVGGRDARGVKGIAEDKPSIVVGPEFPAPIDLAGRLAIAREVFALRRGITSVIYNDDATIASIVVAVCRDAGVQMADPPYAIFKEVERLIHKAMSRRVRKAVQETAEQVARSGQDPIQWAEAARRSIDRMSLIATGDAATVIDDAVGARGTPAREAMGSNLRASRLLSFAMSAEYLELRRKLGMGVS